VPNITIIVPNYNHSRFLKQRLETIFNQTYEFFELILLDDCSTDNSWQILSKYKNHPKVSYCIRNDINSGNTFKQWQKGIELAKGDWIWIAESDDMSSPFFLEKLTSLISTLSNLSLVFCKTFLIDEFNHNNGIHNWGEEIDLKHWEHNFIEDGSNEIQKYLWQRNFIPNASAVLFNKYKALSIIKNITSLKYSGDWLFWALMMNGSKIGYYSIPLNYFRRYPEATSLSNSKSGILNRSVENMYVINCMQRMDDSIILNPYKHKWIIKEWERHKNVMSFVEYIWPPFYLSLKMYFWKRYFSNIINSLKQLLI
jgi:glycosyltransferase involved in cell wall biosynthesis